MKPGHHLAGANNTTRRRRINSSGRNYDACKITGMKTSSASSSCNSN